MKKLLFLALSTLLSSVWERRGETPLRDPTMCDYFRKSLLFVPIFGTFVKINYYEQEHINIIG
jgi:hypothetical protein